MTDRTWMDPSEDAAAVDHGPFYLVYTRGDDTSGEWEETDRLDATGLDMESAKADAAADFPDRDVLVLEVRPIAYSARS